MRIVITKAKINGIGQFFRRYEQRILILLATIISILAFFYYLVNGLGLAYNDARSHLDIGRRVVENLTPGLAQIGSVWLPLPHLLMVPTIWIDWFWHSGLSGAIISMVSYVVTAALIYWYAKEFGIGKIGQWTAVILFLVNLNVIYLQSTAMTELLLMATLTATGFELLRWYKTSDVKYLILSAGYACLSTLTRYDGWFVAMYATLLVMLIFWKRKGWKAVEASGVFYFTLAGFGIALWFMWNIMIFRDPLYFATGPYSARAQQKIIEEEGSLPTKGNLPYSLYLYTVDTIFNVGMFPFVIGVLGLLALTIDRKHSWGKKLVSTALLAPFAFNIIALYFGHSVISLQGFGHDAEGFAARWFNVRYGLMALPAIAVFAGYIVDRSKYYRPLFLSILAMTMIFSATSRDAVTIDDATVGSSQKNVVEVSSWLKEHVKPQEGFVLISAASHDAILFSSGLQMKRFIHEGTGKYWENATTEPDRWARWIVMRTNDMGDNTFRLVNESGQIYKYNLISSYPFADIYELKPEYMSTLHTKPVLGMEKEHY